jgi:hypothetical protein
VVFDEAMNDIPDMLRSPNAKMLRNATLGKKREGDEIQFDVDPVNLDAVESPWLEVEEFETDLRFDYDSPDMDDRDFRPLGFNVYTCDYMKRPVIDIDNSTKGFKLLHPPHGISHSAFTRNYKNAYLLKLGKTYVRDADHVDSIPEDMYRMPESTRLKTIKIQVCRDYRVPKRGRVKKVGLRLPSMAVRNIHMINKLDPAGLTRKEYLERINQPYHPTDIPLDWFNQPPTQSEYADEVILQMNRLEVHDMTPEE